MRKHWGWSFSDRRKKREEETVESDLSEEFGGDIPELEFPEFGGEGILSIDIDIERVIFKEQMNEWKHKF